MQRRLLRLSPQPQRRSCLSLRNLVLRFIIGWSFSIFPPLVHCFLPPTAGHRRQHQPSLLHHNSRVVVPSIQQRHRLQVTSHHEQYHSSKTGSSKTALNMRSCQPWRSRTTSTACSSSSQLSMALIPLPIEDLERLVSTGAPTATQYAAYWGRTEQEQYGRILEISVVSFLGIFFSYFLSFVLGGFLATILGSLFVYWAVLSPELKAYQRNWEFFGGRALVDPWMTDTSNYLDKNGLYGALFLGCIGDVCVVEDSNANEEFDLSEFGDYRMEDDELERFTGRPYLLRILLQDTTDRELQVHARMSEEYLDLVEGMSCAVILLSTSPEFSELAALTDVFVPEAACWVGDYPYLDRAEMEELFVEDDDIWKALQIEGRVEERDADMNEGASENFGNAENLDSE